MANPSDIHLVINSDDFGMCHAVNVGIVKAFTQGILTQASIMVPCPWFAEAAALAIEHDIPVGVHLTATCEFDRYRWGPVTGGKSLVADDGRLPTTTDQVKNQVDLDELEAEFIAQVETALAHGLRPQHIDHHMGVIDAELEANIARRYSLPLKARGETLAADASFDFTSFHGITGRTTDKVADVRELLGTLEPGWHNITVHIAADLPELDHLASPNATVRPWARQYRVADLDTVLDPRVRQTIDARGIKLAAMRDRA